MSWFHKSHIGNTNYCILQKKEHFQIILLKRCNYIISELNKKNIYVFELKCFSPIAKWIAVCGWVIFFPIKLYGRLCLFLFFQFSMVLLLAKYVHDFILCTLKTESFQIEVCFIFINYTKLERKISRFSVYFKISDAYYEVLKSGWAH